jgi:uncharacterized iron-regulated membrane protein
MILVLLGIGSKMIEGFPTLRSWGCRLAGGALVAYGVYGIRTLHPTTADEVTHIVFRGLLVSGLVLALAWIVLAVQGFVYHHATQPVLEWSTGRRAAALERERKAAEEQCRLEAERHAEEQKRLKEVPPRPRTERVKQAIDEAKQDYETDREVIRSLDLRPAERRAALTQAKQKLMRRLQEILK